MTTDVRTRDPRKIEADLDRTRARVGDTLDMLEHKFSPGELFDQALSYVRARGNGELAPNLKQTITRNPLPVTLIGLGIAWLMMSGRRGSVPGEHPSRMRDSEQDLEGAIPVDLQTEARGDQIEGLETAGATGERAGLTAYGGGRAGVSDSHDEVATTADESNPARRDTAEFATYDANSSSSERGDRATGSPNEASSSTEQMGSTTSGPRSGVKEPDQDRLHRRT